MTRQTGPLLTALGLMSGTSLDGVDAAILRTDGDSIAGFGPALTVSYPEDLREDLRALLGQEAPCDRARALEARLTDFHALTVERLLGQAGMAPDEIDLIGFHGHTIFHKPREGRTWQIGDGQRLADRVQSAVINDFRSNDVAAGGQGAPLVPLFHAALSRGLPRPLAILNLGGVGNVTWIGEGEEILAFDTGPGNALIDDWALRHTGRPVDEDGRLARSGMVDKEAVAAFSRHDYFTKTPPKSLDRNDFRHFATALAAPLSAADGAATLSAFTVQACLLAQDHFPAPPVRWLICGGGRRNPVVMAGLRRALPVPVEAVDQSGWDGDALEAQAFAFLAVRSLYHLPLTLPGTTGAPRPLTGGCLHRPQSADKTQLS